MKNHSRTLLCLRLLLWGTLAGGVCAMCLLAVATGVTLRFGVSGWGSTLPAVIAEAMMLLFAAMAGGLTLLRLLHGRWLARPYAVMLLLTGLAAAAVPVLMTSDGRDTLTYILILMVVCTALQALLHHLLSRAETNVQPPSAALPEQHISFGQIRTIDQHSLTWQDEQGHIQTIDLHACARNWQSAHPASSGQCVGQRHAPHCIVLHADEPIALINDRHGAQGAARFHEVTGQLQSAGWRTYDMT